MISLLSIFFPIEPLIQSILHTEDADPILLPLFRTTVAGASQYLAVSAYSTVATRYIIQTLL
jgi:hypothetical protein